MNLIDLLTSSELSLVQFQNYKTNQVIFNEGQLCNKIGIVIEGAVNVNVITYNEKEETINCIKKDGIFGHFLIFTKKPYYLGIGIATRNTKVAFINKNNLLSLLSINKLFLNSYLQIICSDALETKQQAKLFVHKNLRDRIMYYFSNNHTSNVINLTSVTMLAKELSIPRPSLSRELAKMEKDGLIKKFGNTIYINLKETKS